MNRTFLAGIPVDNTTMREALNWITNRIITSRIPAYVATVNLDFLANAVTLNWNTRKSTPLGACLLQSDLVTADGMPVVWLSRLTGTPIKERVAGSDMLPAVLEKASENSWTIFVAGSDPETFTRFTSIAEEKYPGCKIAGSFTGKITTGTSALTSEEENLLALIQQAQPDLLFLALGNPKQEFLFHRLKPFIQVPVSMGIGGSIDLLTGKGKRAPGWVGQIGAEWIVRLIQEPGRLGKRYLKDAWVLLALSLQLLIARIIRVAFLRDEGKEATQARFSTRDTENGLFNPQNLWLKLNRRHLIYH